MEEVPQLRASLEHQKLPFLKQLLGVDAMGRMADMHQISPQFVMSALFEEDFKPFLDEVCRKTVINGDQPPMEVSKEEQANRAKLVSLFRRFHFGDEMSAFEQAVEVNYLEMKYDKYENLQQTGVATAHAEQKVVQLHHAGVGRPPTQRHPQLPAPELRVLRRLQASIRGTAA